MKIERSFLKQEFLAGATTFTTMIYMIFVNSHILSLSGMDLGSVMVATILATAFLTFLIGSISNYPFVLAPAMGLNGFFTFGIVKGGGHPWQTALGVCFCAGLMLLIITASGLRKKIMDAIPLSLIFATIVGIGLFLSVIGLKMGQILIDTDSTLQLGDLKNPVIYLTILGVILILILMRLKISGAIIITTLLMWIAGLYLNMTTWNGLVALPPNPLPTLFQLDILGALKISLIPSIFAIIFFSIFDLAGTLETLGRQGNFINKDGKLPGLRKLLYLDGLGTLIASCLGTSPITIYLESATGITAGGRTGLTAWFCSLFFLLSLFFYPIVSSMPFFASAPALIVIGGLLAKTMKQFNWKKPIELIPSLLIIIGIPLTQNIATGLSMGVATYPFLMSICGKAKEVSLILWVISLLFVTIWGLKFLLEALPY